jgi:hypothetical protein
MTRRTLVRSVLAALGLFLACASGSDAGDVLYHGSFCTLELPWGDLEGDQVGYNHWGAYNRGGYLNVWGPYPAIVNCGGAVENGSLIQTVTVTVYDRNPVTDVDCTLTVVNNEGQPGSIARQTTTGNQVGSIQLVLASTAPTTSGTFHLACEIPPWHSQGGFSHVTTYSVKTP